MIFDITILIVLGCHELCPYKTANLIDKCCVCSTVPLTSCSPISFLLLGSPYSLRHYNIEIRPVSNPAMASKCSSERKSLMFLILSQKLKMIKLSEKGTSKPKIAQKLDLLCQIISQVVNVKEKFLKEFEIATSVNTRMIRKQNSLLLM